MTINSRIDRLMEQLAKENIEKITVVFSDGSKRRLSGGECIDLVAGNTDNIGRFEGGGKGNGLLVSLLNGLLEI